MRLFLALPVNENLALEIATWRDRMLTPQVNWVPVSNYHITLAFLGQVSESKLELLCERCSNLLRDKSIPAGEITIDQTGFWLSPGILWIGPKSWPDSLTRLHESLARIGTSFGAKKDKRAYQPHITLSRKSESSNKPLTEPNFKLSYNTIGLYESKQMRGGVQYEEVASWQLATPRRPNALPRRRPRASN